MLGVTSSVARSRRAPPLEVAAQLAPLVLARLPWPYSAGTLRSAASNQLCIVAEVKGVRMDSDLDLL
jgi:hypothetical protein